MAVLLFRRFGIFARDNRYIRLIRIGARARCSRNVHNLTREHVCFRDRVARREDFLRTRCQGRDRPGLAGQFVLHFDVRDRQVAVVLHRDLVGDRLAQRVRAAVCRSRGRNLLDRDVALLICSIRSCACRLLNVADLCRYRIGEAACKDVCFGDRIGRRRFDRLARFNIFKYTLCKRYTFDLLEGDRLCFIIDIGCGDCERYRIAKLVLLVFDRLRDYQIIVDRRRIIRVRPIRDRQQAILSCDDHVVASRILGSVSEIHHESITVDLCKRDACERDVIFAYQRAAAVCRNVCK